MISEGLLIAAIHDINTNEKLNIFLKNVEFGQFTDLCVNIFDIPRK